MKVPKFFEKIFLITAILLGSFLTPAPAQTPASAQTPFANEFWISTRPTGNMYPNGGTLDSPLDGSTAANFDSNMGSLPPNSTIHILAGTYQTYGCRGYYIKSGDKIFGSGMGVTILQLVPNAPSDDFVLADDSPAGQTTTNDEVADLTLDCNYQGGTHTYHGLGLSGPGMVVKRVKVIHAAFNDPSVNSESWGIVIAGRGELIEDCEVSEFDGGVGGITSISINGSASTYGSGIIRNNRVYLPDTPGAFAFGAGAFDNGVLIEGNCVDGAMVGVYNDTGANTNLIITHNIFKNVRYGVAFDALGNVRQNVTISDNNIMLTTNAPFGPGNIKSGIWIGNNSTNVSILGNTVGWDGEPNPGEIGYDYFLELNEPGDQGILVANNRADPRLATADSGTNGISSGNGYAAHDNFDLSGNPLTNVAQTLPFTNPFSFQAPDAVVQMYGPGSVKVGQLFTPGCSIYGWNCSKNASATIFKPLPLPNDFWGGKTTFVTSWTIWTTNAGQYVFNIGNNYVLTNAVSAGSPQQTVSFTAPGGTNAVTISATNTIPTSDVSYLQAYIWLNYQVQPGNYLISSGKVTAQ